ncbi:MAG TPA: InlB B-repeat-containing protein, partial [Rhodoglobus sp.]|nr:InlB B-repeat-containing protein [Rhodoglobus sp.]
RQQVDRAQTGVGSAWNGGDPIAAIGDRRWTNVKAGADVRFERAVAADNYAAIGVRSSGGGSSNNLNGTGYALKVGSDGSWQLLRMGAVVRSGAAAPGWDAGAWHRLELTAAGATLTGAIDGNEVVSWTDDNPFLSGWVDLASGFHYTQFDDLSVERVAGYLPYYGEYLDGMEQTDLAGQTKLVFDGAWLHANGGGMFEYQRSSSRNQAVGAGVSYTFTGSGLDVIGGDGTARLNVYVDGTLIQANAPTFPANQFQRTFSLRGLPWGEHTVRLEVASGTINVDAVAVASVPAQKPASTDALAAAVEEAQAIERSEDFTDAGWALLQDAIAWGSAAVADPVGYKLDAEGAAQLIARIEAASFPLASRIVSIAPVSLAVIADGEPALPATVTATLDDGSTRELPVEWADADTSRPWSTVSVAGRYGAATVTARVEVVPHGVVAFADVNSPDSPSYRAISELTGGLLNDKADQVLAAGGAWGHYGFNRTGGRDIQYKGLVAGPYDKTTTTGMYTANQVGARVGYTMTLPAGRYTLVAGSYSWWPGSSRSTDVYLIADGTERKVDSFTLNTATPGRTLSYDIDLAADGPVTIELRATNNQSPMLSWVAAVEAAYSVEFDLDGGVGTVPGAQRLLYGDAVAVPSGEPVRNGYRFTGWATTDGVELADGSTYADLAGARDVLGVTVVAQWERTAQDWKSAQVYLAGDQVMRGDRVFIAQWWTRGETPGSTATGAWAELGQPVMCSAGIERQWTKSWVYTGGEVVVHDGKLWQSQWWSRNQQPTPKPWGPWKQVGTC